MGEKQGLNISTSDFYFRISDKIEYDCPSLEYFSKHIWTHHE